MTREEAVIERDRLQVAHPEATWIVGEADGAWRVLKVGIPSPESPTGAAVAAQPRPNTPDSPPAPDKQIVNPNWGF
jgi:hypothetical protein